MSLRWTVDRRQLAKAKVRAAAAEGLFDAAGVLLEGANRTVPHETGALARSGLASVDRAALRAAVSYSTPYAVRQHEDTRLRHDPGRRAKWLEATLAEQVSRLRDHVAGRIREAAR